MSIVYFSGGLFGDDEPENVVNAFKYALYHVNHQRTLLKNMNLMYDIQTLPVTNRFEASKKGKQHTPRLYRLRFSPSDYGLNLTVQALNVCTHGFEASEYFLKIFT